MTVVKKFVSYLLVALVLFFTIVALLGIWDFIDLERILQKMLSSLIVLFASAAVILFIFSVLIKDTNEEK